MCSRLLRTTVPAAVRSAIVGFVLVVFLPTVVHPVAAQSTAGRILGTVTDQSGAAVVSAKVAITDLERGTSRTLATDEAGAYVAADLTPGNYRIQVEARGFKTVQRPSVGVEVATDVRIDFALPPGQVSETIIVDENVPLVNTTSATLGGTLSNQEINDLPLNGRNYENLLQLRPGVMRYPGGGFSTTSTNGLRAEDNAYFVEGLFNSEPFSGQGIINGAGIAGDSATILPIDTIQEFNVQENPSAEYGWKPGAVVNVGLKSGTNMLHGSAFAFGRDGAMDARNYFNCSKNPCTMPAAGNCIFLATGDCANSIPDVIADLEAGGITVSPASLQVAGCAISAGTVTCNGKGFPTNNNPSINIVNGFPNQVGVDNALGKVDYNFNRHHSVSGFYFFGNNSGTVEDFPELQSFWRSKIHTRAQVVGGNWIWTPNERWVNEARVGYNRLYQPTLPGDLNAPASSYGLNTGVSGPLTGGLPRIGFAGYFFPGLGAFKWPKFQGPDTITQFIDHVSYIKGKHAIKLGGELHREGFSGGAFGNARGSITFLGGNTPDPANPATTLNTSQLEDFFSGAPFKASVQTGDPRRQIHDWEYSAFLQDDWRATKNLTINVGLRYEYRSDIKEAHNLLGNFDRNSPTGLIQAGLNGVSGPYNPDGKNFAPRFGFAWDVMGKGKTVLRGGASRPILGTTGRSTATSAAATSIAARAHAQS